MTVLIDTIVVYTQLPLYTTLQPYIPTTTLMRIVFIHKNTTTHTNSGVKLCKYTNAQMFSNTSVYKHFMNYLYQVYQKNHTYVGK